MTETNQVALLRDQAEQLRDWMFDASFPLWAGTGIHPSGLCFEALDFHGEPVQSSVVRVRVLARQLFVFSLAARMGWQPERCAPLIRSLFDVLHGSCRRDDQLFGRAYDLERGEMSDGAFGLYDTAFALLGFAVAREHLGGAVTDAAITATLAGLDSSAAHPDGGFLEEMPAPKDRLQNPHMHLFESCLALKDAGYANGIEERVETLARFISGTFFDNELGLVHERRPGELLADTTFEPGHSLEWVWLLTWHARGNNKSVEPIAQRFYQEACDTLDGQGFACMEASVGGVLVDPSCRLWAQAEALKAHISMATVAQPGQRQPYLERASVICRGIQEHWLKPAVAGGWHDHFDASGGVIAKNMPASTGYHLYGAIDTLLNGLRLLESTTTS